MSKTNEELIEQYWRVFPNIWLSDNPDDDNYSPDPEHDEKEYYAYRETIINELLSRGVGFVDARCSLCGDDIEGTMHPASRLLCDGCWED